MAKLVSWNKIELNHFENNAQIDFFINDLLIPTQRENSFLYFDFDNEILGNKLTLKINGKEEVVSILECSKFLDFDDRYFYDGNDLGSTYYKDHTEFVIWAPLASKVFLRINDELFEMIRGNKGIYKISLNGDFDGALYDYIITIDEKEIISIDPYAKSSNANAEKSAVINLEKLKINTNSNCLDKFNNYVEAIIYETHVRDFTIHHDTNIINKGKYLGLIEEGKISKENNPVGLDYLKSLGITHLQLLPVLDYGSVDEIKIDKYNWGYDPMQFFALEGSYSLNPNDPYSRMIEFKKLVSMCHKNNIRINLDVVYNHVYKYKEFSLEKITPNYFFRFEKGKLSDHSFCGNDFCSERKMARKIIVDSILFLLKTYDVDGFRFDLMGLLDVETINEVTRKVKEIKPDAMIYGEGWDMFVESSYGAIFANYKNANLLNDVAFFNDSYRNIVKGLGSTSKQEKNGYLFGNDSFYDGFLYAYLGSTSDYPFPHLFTNLNQTINYVECHDNATLYDVISDSSELEDKERIIKLFNKTILLSPGIPFIHMGQEFGLSKKSHSNTYNEGDLYNQFDPNLMDKRMDLVNSFKGYIELRKSIPLFKESNIDFINEKVSFNKRNNILDIKLISNNVYHILINNDNVKKSLDDECYKKMELVVPIKLKSYDEPIYAYSVDIGPNKCSIYKEI